MNNVVDFPVKSGVFVKPIVEDEIDAYIEKVIPLIKPAIDKNERNVSMEDVVEDILDTRSLMWAVYIGDTLSAAFTTSVLRHPRRSTLFIEFMGGTEDIFTNANYLLQPILKDFYIFPASLRHAVYPFHSSSDMDERISFSFNAKIVFDEK